MKTVTDSRPVVGKSPDDLGYMSIGPGNKVLKRAFAREDGTRYRLYKYDFSGGFWNPIAYEDIGTANSRGEAERRLLRYLDGPEFLRD